MGGKVWSMRHKLKSFDGDYETLQEKDWDLNVLLGDIRKYDNIFATEVMQFVTNPQNVIDNFYNMLWTGGRLYLSFHLGRLDCPDAT